jgi:hypothetical protein
MKIIKRHNYKLEQDQLIGVALSERYAKELCRILNSLEVHEFRMYYFQVVNDNFEIK